MARSPLLTPPDPADAIKLLEPDQPIALLPVRIETRFGRTAAGVGAACPHLSRRDPLGSHEPELTSDELAWGKAFAKEASAGGTDAQMRAWVKLASRFGPRRAAWIAEVMPPSTPTGTRWRRPTSPPLEAPLESRSPRRGPAGRVGPARLPGRYEGPDSLVRGDRREPLSVGPSPRRSPIPATRRSRSTTRCAGWSSSTRD